MAFVLADRVKETTIVVGTGAATLLGAASGYQSFSAGIGASNTTYYTIADQSGTNWEVGYGTLDATGLILTRTTVLSSSNSGSAVSFTTGTKDVWCDYTAKKAVIQDSSGNVTVPGTVTANSVLLTGNLGTVTSVTGTSPIVSSGGTTPAISMAAANTTTSGYLTSTDWNTFNGKGTGTVTSVTGTAPVVSSGGTTPAISMSAASSGVNGYMTGTYATKLDGIATGATANTGTVTSVAATAGTGISITGSPITTSGTLNITNSGVTSLIAGTGISISGSTGAVTVTNTSSASGTVTSVATGNGLSGGPITTSGTIVLGAPSYLSVGSYVLSINSEYTGSRVVGGVPNTSVAGIDIWINGGTSSYGAPWNTPSGGTHLSGTWRVLGLAVDSGAMLFLRIA